MSSWFTKAFPTIHIYLLWMTSTSNAVRYFIDVGLIYKMTCAQKNYQHYQYPMICCDLSQWTLVEKNND